MKAAASMAVIAGGCLVTKFKVPRSSMGRVKQRKALGEKQSDLQDLTG